MFLREASDRRRTLKSCFVHVSLSIDARQRHFGQNCKSGANLTFKGAQNNQYGFNFTVSSIPKRRCRANLTDSFDPKRRSGANLTATYFYTIHTGDVPWLHTESQTTHTHTKSYAGLL